MADNLTGTEIAIVGMAGRYPRSRNLAEFWRHLHDGDELITFFSEADLAAAGVSPAQIDDPNFVRAAGELEDTERFDAGFFGVLPREAELMDPQQRLFLECAWEALEHAGYDPERFPGLIGVYAGAVENTYLLFNLITHPQVVAMGLLPVMVVNGRDYLPTRVSYKLNLRGPSCLVQSACSTSLVAIHTACQSLLNRECDLALAGGVSVLVNQRMGYQYSEGGILSPDGHCRTFDAAAQGTIFGSGLGLVVLKRLSDALRDNDSIHALIRGSAVNNDGAQKASYTAPAVSGQAEVIIEALAVAGVAADTIGYVEAHGTATALGDTIEVQALSQAFRTAAAGRQFCAIGTVKTNLGHLDAAAGVTGLIKAVLALKHGQIPPNLHYTQPNPKIDFANSPFYVNAQLHDWPAGASPRRAGVNSFGIGGTNAHVVLEEAPAPPASAPTRPWQLLLLSAKTASALETQSDELAGYLAALDHDTYLAPLEAATSLADVAYTLQVGRACFAHRRAVLCRDRADALAALQQRDPTQVLSATQEQRDRPVAFLLPGQGAQYLGMGRGLYASEPVFRAVVDRCAALLQPQLGRDLRELLFGPAGDELINKTAYTQPALFTIEYALASLLMAWGVRPYALLGHSVGEYVAACLAGVFTLEDALRLVAVRGRLIGSLPGGAMLAVPLPEAELVGLLPADVSLAAVNGPAFCSVAGPTPAITALEAQLLARGIQVRRLHTSHAFHSAMMEPILAAFAAELGRVTPQPPQLPFLSNLTGDWITAAEATDPQYWVRHLRQPVRFDAGLRTLLAARAPVLLEVGPGRTLSTFARQPGAGGSPVAPTVFGTLRHPGDTEDDLAFLLRSIGQLWLAGVTIDWAGFYRDEQRRRVPLPTYPFERQRFWIDPHRAADGARVASQARQARVADWFYVPYWQPSALGEQPAAPGRWLLLGQPGPLRDGLIARLRAAGHDLLVAPDEYALEPSQASSYAELLAALDPAPQQVIYCAGPHFDLAGLLALAQALGRQAPRAVQLSILTQAAQQVQAGEPVDPWQALLLGPALVIPQEHAGVACRSIDVRLPAHGYQAAQLYDGLLAELAAPVQAPVLAYRGGQRWVQAFAQLPLPAAPATPLPLRQGGTYLITGGFGRIGQVLARYLAANYRANLALLGRAELPPRDRWHNWLAAHDPQEPTSARIRLVQELEAAGARVLALSADVADQPALQAALGQIEQQFGALHGVIHAAGIVDEQHAFVLLQDLTPAVVAAQLRPKVAGALALAAGLGDRALDFCMLCSSTATLLGGLGFGAYAAANRFMDALAQQQPGQTPWISVAWDGWLFPGVAPTSGLGARMVEQAMTPEQGLQAFIYALGLLAQPRVIVSTGDVQARLDHWVHRHPQQAQPATLADQHQRPVLQTAYVAPRNDIEATIAAIWQQLLGIGAIGVFDHFFELGGHSLLATQLLSQVRNAFGVDIPIRQLFEAPTIAGQALLVLQAQLGVDVDDASLRALLEQAEGADPAVAQVLAEDAS